MSKNNAKYWWWLVLGLALLIRVFILFQPSLTILDRWGSDDLYYYTQIAGNVAAGNGFSFDGLHLTNGFQPLFEFLLIPFGKWLWHDVEFSLKFTLLLVSVLTMIAGWQLRLLCRQWNMPPRIALLAPAILLLHPKILSVTFNGTEGALSLLMLVLSLRSLEWMQEKKHTLWISVIFSLLVLTRMDFTFFLMALFAYGMFRKQSFFHWVKVLVTPVLVFAAWMSLNYVYFKSIVPSSGAAKMLHSALLDYSIPKVFLSTWSTALFAETQLSWVVLVLVIFGVIFLLMKHKQLAQKAIFLIGASSVLGIIAIVSIGYFRDWYLMPQYLTTCILMAFGVSFLLERLPSFNWKSLLVLVPLGLIWTEAHFTERKMNRTAIYNAIRKFELQLPSGELVGTFNAGLLGTILGPNTRVINLDGVVNNSVLPYQKNKQLDRYLEQENISFLIDHSGSIDFFREQFMPDVQLEVIAKERIQSTEEWTLVRVQ